MTELLDESALRENYTALVGSSSNGARNYKYIRPFERTADSLLDVLKNVEARFMLGLPQIDVLTRGFGKHELALIVGFAHAGKTQLVNTLVMNNLDKRIVFFSLDDPAEMILTKLICMREGYSAEELEHFVRNDPVSASEFVKRHARQTFGNLMVLDEPLSLGDMSNALKEAEDYWGEPVDAVVIDYLQLVPGEDNADYADTKGKAQAIKRWTKTVDCPVIVLHQTTRTKGGPGEVVTMLSGAYGGEQEGTFMLGVRRKRFDESLDEWERDQHTETITLHLVKNKRPPGRLTRPDGIDFFMDPDTGMIRELQARDYDKRGARRVAQQADRRRHEQEDLDF